MARDYSGRSRKSSSKAKTKSNGKRSNGGKTQPAQKRRSAPRKNTRKTSRTPGWVWMGSGLFIGLTVAAVFYIVSRPVGQPGRDATTIEVPQPKPSHVATQSTKETPKQSKKTAGKSEQTKFAFYEMLPDYDATNPGQAAAAQSDNNADTTSNAGQRAPAQQSQPAATTTESADGYVIQVGAFSTNEDANQLKAQVALLGLHANVIRSRLDSGDVIYRVRSDVIASNNRLTEMLKRLHDNDIDTLVLQQ